MSTCLVNRRHINIAIHLMVMTTASCLVEECCHWWDLWRIFNMAKYYINSPEAILFDIYPTSRVKFSGTLAMPSKLILCRRVLKPLACGIQTIVTCIYNSTLEPLACGIQTTITCLKGTCKNDTSWFRTKAPFKWGRTNQTLLKSDCY